MNGFDPLDEAIDEALGENPRAAYLTEMISALEVRRESFEREFNSASTDANRKLWRVKLQEVDKQIAILRSDQAVSGFVERSVRASATW